MGFCYKANVLLFLSTNAVSGEAAPALVPECKRTRGSPFPVIAVALI